MRAFLFGINYTICGFASWFLWLLVEIRGRVFKVLSDDSERRIKACSTCRCQYLFFLKKIIIYKKNEEEFGCTFSYMLRTYLCESGPNL